jgi:hypothetical protein
LFFVALLLPAVVSAEPAKTNVSVVCVDGEKCSWLEPLGERLAQQLFLKSKVAPLEMNGNDVVRSCRKGMSPEEADACVRDAVRAAAAGLGAAPNRVVLRPEMENGEVVRGSAQIVQGGKAETALFTLVPIDAARSLRAGFGTPEKGTVTSRCAGDWERWPRRGASRRRSSVSRFRCFLRLGSSGIS